MLVANAPTPEERKAERHTVVVCSMAAILLGIAALIGWGLAIPVLTRVVPGYKAIAPSVAICLIVLGLILPLLAPASVGRRERLLMALVTGLVSLFGLLEVLGFFAAVDLNLEEALTGYVARASSIPFETMSPIAGALLFLIGAAMLALAVAPVTDKGSRSLGNAAGVLGSAATIAALVCGLGYAYGAPVLYGSSAIPISAVGVLGALFLSVGTVAAAGRDCWPLRALAGDSTRARLVRVFVPLTILTALTISIAEQRLVQMEGLNHVLMAAVLAVFFALSAGMLASRVAHTIGEAIDQARLAQRHAQEQLRESRDDLTRAQAVAHTGSWRLNVQRNELLWSDETHRIFEIPKDAPMTYETFLAAVHPDDQGFVDTSWQAALRGEPYDIEHRIVLGDKVKWVRERAGLEFDEGGVLLGGFGTVQDITERKQAEAERERLFQQLQRQTALLEAILENTDAHLVYLDRDFNFIWVNSAYARACRRSREEFIGHNHFEFYPHPENEAIFRRVRDTSEPARYLEKPFEFPDMPERGITYWDWTLTPLKNAQGQVENLIFSLADVTEKVRARQQLVEAERLRTQMAEMVALEINHRMKNNLMLVSGILELQLSSLPPASDAARALQQAKARISALSTVHEQMYEQRSGRVELSDVLRRIGEVAAAALAMADVELSVTGDFVYVPSRAATTFAVVSNELVTNALKHGAPAPDGTRRVRVALSHQNGQLRLNVWNSGNSIPPGFDLASQRGLGLHLCRELVAGELRGSFTMWPQDGGTMSEIVVDEQYLKAGDAK
jgi:PAS domain S-box-containing protein